MTLTLSASEGRATAAARELSRGVRVGSVYVIRAGFVLRAVTADELAHLPAPEILATFRGGEEVETPESYAYVG